MILLACQTVSYLVSYQLGIGHARSFLAWTFHAPPAAFVHQVHLAPLSPPIGNIPWEGIPDVALSQQVTQMTEQGLVSILLTLFHDVVGVNDEANQPVILPNQGDLLFPQVDRVVIENLKECVVLRARDGKFNDLA